MRRRIESMRRIKKQGDGDPRMTLCLPPDFTHSKAVPGDVDIAMYTTSLFFWVGVPRDSGTVRGHTQEQSL
jgi:hypothetical protein